MPPPAVPHGMCLKVINNRSMKGGMGSETNPLRFMDQDFNVLQDYCLKTKQRFVDEFFPPDPRSIVDHLTNTEGVLLFFFQVLCPNAAELIVETVSRFDYAQGRVGNCWFLASVGALTFQTKLLHKVIPDGQSFSHNYTGLFHFRFWRFGNWYDVVIDDKLPTIGRQLIFVKSKTFNEFWPALVEKAYAKVCGSYADMHAGRVSEALLDFTGGVHMHYELKTAPTDLWEIMHRAYQIHLFYLFIYCRMSMNDFLRTFDNMDICCICPDFLEGKSACHWISKYHHGSWISGSTDGGGINSFCKNPQFWLKVNEFDKACEQGQNNVLVTLIQKPDKRHRRHSAHHGIGFYVFAIPPGMRSEGKLGSSFFLGRKPVVTSEPFQRARQVMKFFRLEPGEYLIVPSTYQPKTKGEFILSILCKNEIHIQTSRPIAKTYVLLLLPRAVRQ
uniref:Si:ch211-202f3.3 n=1 Tax=Cyprinus carpio TaxID=7962 RepID=A0A8C1FWW4_CYPCA